MIEREYEFKDGKHYVKGGMIPPMIVDLVTKKAIIPWWVNVPLDTTLDDIIWERGDMEIIKPQSNIIEVASSSGEGKYQIKKIGDKYQCNCPGYWRSKDRICKHIKQIIN